MNCASRNDLIETIRDNQEHEDAERANGEADSGEQEQTEEQQPDMPEGLSTPVNVAQSEKPKKKKKKKKSKTANLPEAGADIADNFEEKYKEDVVENPYDPSRPLNQRVEYAIWKYRKNHRFTDSKRSIFDNYLKFGGIKTGPNAFMGRATGGDQDADGEADWDAAKIGTDTVPNADEDDEGLEVNFTEVAQVYLGNTFIRETRFIGQQDFIDAPVLIDAFLRYLQIRNVCPEYADDISRAREVIAKAKIELPMCKRAAIALPGTFNRACNVLFGGGMKVAWVTEASWMQATSKTQKLIDQFMSDTVGSVDDETRNSVSAVVGDYTKRTVVDERKDLFVKIMDIAGSSSSSSEQEREQQEEITKEEDPLVEVILADYENEQDTFKILLEKSISQELLKGMVMTVAMYKLDSGHWYLDRAGQIMPTFYMVDDCLDSDAFLFE
ncbi:Argonaute siRNA chaperone complex subunit Arb1-domain-containing protein [Zychaea mexicana]|uniref:Argonaute siRNA chaperone complex subunit Arb1-domain-containing protein n=1 Tax=Zychaea mexicana TaxID=64656 RepID=UPI0022FE701E|nr:Argonaute siRNA chaperone complex subunit Arb1-domain-containing protein [Zychaea mexicana]KAI9498127.1 Argonaute siRNA chaperone complex subunit Arb1-domain-containing protein [Zychaea mexicana]